MLNETLHDFNFQATSEVNSKLSDHRGKWLILYFYPRDATPGCTTEGQDFRDHYEEFKKLNAEVFGISRDSMKSHEKFKANQEFPFELISDPDEELCQLFLLCDHLNHDLLSANATSSPATAPAAGRWA